MTILSVPHLISISVVAGAGAAAPVAQAAAEGGVSPAVALTAVGMLCTAFLYSVRLIWKAATDKNQIDSKQAELQKSIDVLIVKTNKQIESTDRYRRHMDIRMDRLTNRVTAIEAQCAVRHQRPLPVHRNDAGETTRILKGT